LVFCFFLLKSCIDLQAKTFIGSFFGGSLLHSIFYSPPRSSSLLRWRFGSQISELLAVHLICKCALFGRSRRATVESSEAMQHELVVQKFRTTVFLKQLVVIVFVVDKVIRREFVPCRSHLFTRTHLLLQIGGLRRLKRSELGSADVELAVLEILALLNHVGLVLTTERH
jgi:hypothetical protein